MMDRYIQLKPLRDMNELTLQSKFIFYFYLKFITLFLFNFFMLFEM